MNKLIEQKDHWILQIVGRQVTRCLVDAAFSIEFYTKDSTFTLTIETRFLFQNVGESYELDPGTDPTALGPVLALFRKLVVRAIAWKDGRLEIDFDDGSSLHVQPDSHYEAWNLAGPSMQIVCTPGGELAVWD